MKRVAYLSALFFLGILLWNYAFLSQKLLTPWGIYPKSYYFFSSLGVFLIFRLCVTALSLMTVRLGQRQHFTIQGHRIGIRRFTQALGLLLDVFLVLFITQISWYLQGLYLWLIPIRLAVYLLLGAVIVCGGAIIYLSCSGLRQGLAVKKGVVDRSLN